MKKIILLSSILCLLSCEKENKIHPDIKLGDGNNSLTEIFLHKFTERNIILSGGNEKFSVNIANSKIAQASIHQDTLKIKGLWEGQTFATITSHDKKARLIINIIPPELSISQDSIRLYPKDESKYVSIGGGGDKVELIEDDPNNSVQTKWNGNTGILEIKAFHEGDAVVRFKSTQWKGEKQLKISVIPEGNSQEIGIYKTNSRSYYHILNPKMIVKRPNIGYWLSQNAKPYSTSDNIFTTKYIAKITPTVIPQNNKYVDIHILFDPNGNSFPEIKQGKHQMYVKQVTDSTFSLLGKGFKIILPK